VIVAALALASACSGGSDTPRALPSLTSSATPSATAVAVPSAAKAATPQGLDQFVRFYFGEVNRAFATGDPSLIRALRSPACESCENYAKSLSDGNHIAGDTFTQIDVAAPPLQPSETIVEVTGRVPARDVVDATGRVVKHLPATGPFHLQVNVLRQAGSWLVRGIRTAP
jgi:hypothetical protein